jgi:polyisoprenoid-binding protein YceI
MKYRIAFVFIFFFLPLTVLAQGRYVTKTGEIDFEASVPSFEEVKAKNNNVSAILKTDTGEFAALALMKGFRFKVALMEEHFNENYIESSKFPKATFKGKILDFESSKLSETAKEYIVAGTITMHGVDKLVELPASLTIVGNIISMNLQFTLKPEDFNIEIPKIVSSKIAEKIDVLANFSLTKPN